MQIFTLYKCGDRLRSFRHRLGHILYHTSMFSIGLLNIIVLWAISFQGSETFKPFEKSINKHDMPFYIMPDYYKEVLPMKNGVPVNITVLIKYLGISEINDVDSAVTMRIILEMSWRDFRLRINDNSSMWTLDRETNQKYTYLNSKWHKYLWTPDSDIVNLQTFEIGKNLNEHRTLRLSNNSRLWYNIPVVITISCPLFDFKDYPFDKQVCVLLVGSFRYHIKENVYMGYLIRKVDNQKHLQYKVKDVVSLSFGSCILNYDHYHYTEDGNLGFRPVKHSHFGIKIEFERSLKLQILTTFLPSTTLIFICWVGFLVDFSNVVGRLLLQLTSLLGLLIMRYVSIKFGNGKVVVHCVILFRVVLRNNLFDRDFKST